MKKIALLLILSMGLWPGVTTADELLSAKTLRPLKKDFEKRIDSALKSLSFEPSLEELKKAALKFADADIERAKKWRRAPNAAAALPTVKFVFNHDLERDETLDRYQDEPDRWGADTDRDLNFQVSVQWQLDELIFNPDEVRVWNALADRAARRDAVLTVLVGTYFERQKLQVKKLLSPPNSLDEAVQLKLRTAELTASIDAMTGGLLSRRLNTVKKN
jgi:hypothetical protein